MAIVVALCCSGFAVFWAFWHLKKTALALRFQPALLMRGMRGGGADVVERFDRSLRTDQDAWEAQLVREVARSPSPEAARAEVNTALLEVDALLSPSTRVYAACVRIAVFGCLIGVALLFMGGRVLTMAVLDVFAIGASGMLAVISAGKECRRLAERKRHELDDWADGLLRGRWGTDQG